MQQPDKWERLQMVSPAVRHRGRQRAHTKFSHDTCGGLTLYWTAENAKLDCCLHLLSKACPRRGRGMQLLALSPKGEDEEAATSKCLLTLFYRIQNRGGNYTSDVLDRLVKIMIQTIRARSTFPALQIMCSSIECMRSGLG